MKSVVIILLGVICLTKLAHAEKVTPRKYIARKVIVELSKAGYTVSNQKVSLKMNLFSLIFLKSIFGIRHAR